MHMVSAEVARYKAAELASFAAALFAAAGISNERAAVIAEVLLEGDLMGHSTHGLQLVSRHLQAVKNGAIAREGEPGVVADAGASLTWDGCYLPGPWLVRKAMDVAFERMKTYPVVTVVIRRAGHIGCLAAYPRLAAERNLMMLLASSDPAVRVVAPHGSSEPRYTPNPIAAGWPTRGEPVVIDTCPSTTTAGMVARLVRAGKSCGGDWLIDVDGQATSDPGALSQGGAILPLGGTELGHKGFALGLIVEALTSALAGYGRADQVGQDGAAVFLQLIDPAAFGGGESFVRETDWLAGACRSASPRPGQSPVRMPGERGLALRKEQLLKGVVLHADTIPALRLCAAEFGIAMPKAIGA